MSQKSLGNVMNAQTKESVEYFLGITLYGFAIPLFAILFITLLYRKIRPFFKVKVQCWFCNETCVVPYGNLNCWDCPKCEQYNGFSEDGDYNKPIPSQYCENLNYAPSAQRTRNSPEDNYGKILCDNCNNNQLLKVKHVASFEPRCEDTYYNELEDYKVKLERAYKLCVPCDRRVDLYLRQQDESIQRDLIDNDIPLPRIDHNTTDSIYQNKDKTKKCYKIFVKLMYLVQSMTLIIDTISLVSNDKLTTMFIGISLVLSISILSLKLLKSYYYRMDTINLLLLIVKVSIESYNSNLLKSYRKSLQITLNSLVFILNLFNFLRLKRKRKEQYHFAKIPQASFNMNSSTEDVSFNNSLDNMSIHTTRKSQVRKRNILSAPRFNPDQSNRQYADSAIYEDRSFDDDNFTSVSCRMSPGSGVTVVKGVKVTSRRLIIRRYLIKPQLFLFDVISFIPLFGFRLYGFNSQIGRYLSLARLFRYPAINRIVYRHEDIYENRQQLQIPLTRFLLTCVLPVHIMACLWFHVNSDGWHGDNLQIKTKDYFQDKFIANIDDDTNWIVKAFTTMDYIFNSYIVCFYWACITATLTGYGDLCNTDSLSIAYVLICMLLSMIFIHGIQLGKMASWFSNRDNSRARYFQRVSIIKSHVNRLGVPEYLVKNVIGYYEYLWKRKRGTASNNLLSDMPITIRSELAMVTGSFLIEKSRILRELSIGIIRMLALNVKTRLFLPKQVVLAENQIGNCLYYILRGKLEVLGHRGEVLTILSTGRIIGEADLIISRPRPATVRAHTHVELLILEKANYQSTLQNHPREKDHLKYVLWQMCTHAHSCAKKEGDIEREIIKRTAIQPPPVFSEEQAKELNKGQPFLIRTKDDDQYNTEKTWSTFRHIHYSFRFVDNYERSLTKKFQNVTKLSEDEDTIDSNARSYFKDFLTYSALAMLNIRNKTHALVFDIWINPQSRGFTIWCSLLIVSMIQMGCFLPLLFAFGRLTSRIKSLETTYSGQTLIILTNLFGEAIFVIDIVIRLKLAIVTRKGVLRSWKAVFQHYIKTYWFFIDLTSVLLVPVLLFSYYGIDFYSFYHAVRLINLIKLIRLPNLFSRLEHGPAGQLYITITILKWYLLIVLFNHWCACAFFASACKGRSCDSGSWIEIWCRNHKNVCKERTIMIEYLLSYYWAVVTMTSTGFGDITPKNVGSMIIACAVVFMGLFSFGTCQAYISAYLANLNESKVNFRQYVQAVQSFMDRRKLDKKLKDRVISYLDVVWHYFEGEWVPGQKPLLYDSPVQLQKELATENVAKTLNAIPLFHGLHSSYINYLSEKLQVYIFAPGDIVSRAGNVERVTYIIMRGWVGLYTPDHSTLLTKFGPHSHYGELTMMSGEPRPFHLVAITHAEILELCLSDVLDATKTLTLAARQLTNLLGRKDIYKPSVLSRKSNYSINNEIRLRIPETLKVEKNGEDSKKEDKEMEDNLHHTNISINGLKDKKERKDKDFNDNSPSLICRLCVKLLLPFTIRPQSNFLRIWTVFRLTSSILAAFVIPLQTVFYYDVVGVWIVSYFTDLLALINVYLMMHVAFYSDRPDIKGVLIRHPISTALRYLRKNSGFDLLCLFPFEIFYKLLPQPSRSILQTICLLRWNRILQVLRITLLLSWIEKPIDRNPIIIRAIKYLLSFGIIVNTLVCLIILFSCSPFKFHDDNVINFGSFFVCHSKGWHVTGIQSFNSSIYVKEKMYLMGLTFTLSTLVGVGYGDMVPQTVFEVIYVILMVVGGQLLCSYVIAAVSASIVNADAAKQAYFFKMRILDSILEDQEIPLTLRNRIQRYFEFVWTRTKGVDPKSLFTTLPTVLWQDVTTSLYFDAVRQIDFFNKTSDAFLKMLCKSISPMFIPKNELVIRRNDLGTSMFFIWRGSVDIISEDDRNVIDHLGPGESFGEVSFFFGSPRPNSVRARTNCDLFCLSREALEDLLNLYPDVKMQMQKEADNRLKLIAKRRKLNDITDDDSYANISDNDFDSGDSCPPQSEKDMDENRGYIVAVEGTKMKLWSKPKTAIVKSPDEVVINELEPYSPIIERLRNLADNWRELIDNEKDETCDLLHEQKKILENPPWIRKRHLVRHSITENPEDKEEEELRMKFPKIRNYQLIAGKKQPARPLNSYIMGLGELNCNISNNNEISTFHRENNLQRIRFNRLFNSGIKHKFQISRIKDSRFSIPSYRGMINQRKRISEIDYKDVMVYRKEIEYKTKDGNDLSNTLYIPHLNSSNEEFTDRNNSFILNYGQKNSTTLHPDARIVKIIYLLGAISTYLAIALSSYRLAFTDERLLFAVILYTLDFIFFLEILSKTRIQVPDADGDLITNWKEIMKRYLLNYFGLLFDLLTILPVELFFSKFQIRATIRLLRSLLRFIGLVEFFNSWRSVLHANIFYMRGAACFVYFSLTIHLSSCVWFWVACPYGYCKRNSWVNKLRGLTNETSSIEKRVLYLDSLYFIAATITTTGYGDIVPKTFWEMVVACFIVIFGKIVVGSVFAIIASTLANVNSLKARHNLAMSQTETFMEDQHVPDNLKKRILAYRNYVWKKSKGMIPNDLLAELPLCLKSEVSLFIYKSVLDTLSLLRNVNSDVIMRQLALKMKSQPYAPGDTIIRRGDIISKLFYVKRGYLEVVEDTGDKQNHVLEIRGPGTVFGEPTLVFPVPHTSTLRASTHAEVMSLNKTDLDEVLSKHPKAMKKIKNNAFKRFGHLIQRLPQRENHKFTLISDNSLQLKSRDEKLNRKATKTNSLSKKLSYFSKISETKGSGLIEHVDELSP
ncbi:DgyrCDS10444 [Dimorphilus gyrociliatus]|uniref:DgyrCDS10444 n=1 Tax=Dimorphilus gyrociliatus TaxID=2664684 RepID=A0A7I8W0B2_9ANNE|nr:DgyrCDS10444 [Dimorphilus gyrociliatus]